MEVRLMLVALVVLAWPSATHAARCPWHCMCRDGNTHVDCSGQQLKDMPDLPLLATTVDLSRNLLGPDLDNSDIFARMPNLTFVDLSYNGLTSLPGCIFRGLANLRTVILRGNGLTTLPDNLFTDSRQVEHLDLSENKLTLLPGGIMSDMPKLKILEIANNLITNLVLTARFQAPKDIEYLDFSHNNLTAVTENAFEMAKEWSPLVSRTVKVRFCGLKTVSEEGFSKIPSLTTLDLTGNPGVSEESLNAMLKKLQTSKRLHNLTLAHMNLRSIDSLFNEVAELPLKLLNLSHNSIQDVQNNVFQNIPNIHVLDVSYNQLGEMSQGLRNLHSLKYLNVSHNRMTSFTGDNVNQLTALLHLDLSHNLLADGNRVSLAPLALLETLDVSDNQLPVLVLPSSTAFLTHLDYHNNQVGTLNSIENAPMLQHFDISGNKLNALPAFLFRDEKFMKLTNFSGNNISSIHEQTFMPQSPLVIDLSNNVLTRIPKMQWVATQTLILRRNHILLLDPQAFSRMNGLEYLDLSSNQLGHLDENVFQHHISLKHLDLSRNALADVYWPFVVRNLESILLLDLSFNKLIELPDNMLDRLVKVEKVYLQNNYIKFINPMVFRDLTNLVDLDLSSNPFDCTCDMLAFRDWIKRKASIITDLELLNSTKYQCHSPSSRAGTHITQWDTGILECNRSMLYGIVFAGIGVGLFLVGVVLSVIYRFYKKHQKAREEWKQQLEKKLEEEWNNKKKVDYIRMVKQEVAEEIWNAITKRDRRHDRYQPLRVNPSDHDAHDPWRPTDKERRHREYPDKNRHRQSNTDIPEGQEGNYVNFSRYQRDGYGNHIPYPAVYGDYRKDSDDSRIFYTANSRERLRPSRHSPIRGPVTGWQDREGWQWSKQWMLQDRFRRPDHVMNGYLTVPSRRRDEPLNPYDEHYQQEVRFDQSLPRRHSKGQDPNMPRSKSFNYLPQDARSTPQKAALVAGDNPETAGRPQDNPDRKGRGRKIGRAVSQPYLSSAGMSDWL